MLFTLLQIVQCHIGQSCIETATLTSWSSWTPCKAPLTCFQLPFMHSAACNVQLLRHSDMLKEASDDMHGGSKGEGTHVLLSPMGHRCVCLAYVVVMVILLRQVASVPEPLENQEIVTLRLRFLDLAEGSMQQKSLTATISRPAEAPESVLVDPDMQEAVHRVNTANAITAAVRAADEGRVPQ